MPPRGNKRDRIGEEERPPVPSPIENRARQRRRTQPAGTPPPRIPAPRQTPPPPTLSEQFAELILGGMPPRSPAPSTPPTYMPVERQISERQAVLERLRREQEARDRISLAQLAPFNPSNALQMGGASQYALDWGVSQRRLRPPTPPSTESRRSGMSEISSLTDSFDSRMSDRAVRQSPSPFQLPPSAVDGVANRMSIRSPYRSPDGVFNFEDEFDYKSSSSGSGMKRLARYYKK